MPSESAPASPTPELCSQHQLPVQWHCGVCQQPLCRQCKPIAFNYQVYHSACLPVAQQQLEKKQSLGHRNLEAPSLGLKIIAWIFMVGGIVAFGTCLFLLGVDWFGEALPIRTLISNSPVSPNLDSIPGLRMSLFWIAMGTAVAGVGAEIVGIGLLNCVAAVRKGLLFFSWLEIIVAAGAWLVVFLLGQGFWDIPVFAIFLIWFLSLPSVKAQFAKVP